MTPVFLSVEQVERIHQTQIELFGGSPGLRDRALLESAVAAPSASFGGQYLHADIFEMAAALLFALAKNHPFVDGNKRVATAAALTFLLTNGKEIAESEPDLGDLVIAVAEGRAGKNEIADFLRNRVET